MYKSCRKMSFYPISWQLTVLNKFLSPLFSLVKPSNSFFQWWYYGGIKMCLLCLFYQPIWFYHRSWCKCPHEQKKYYFFVHLLMSRTLKIPSAILIKKLTSNDNPIEQPQSLKKSTSDTKHGKCCQTEDLFNEHWKKCLWYVSLNANGI